MFIALGCLPPKRDIFSRTQENQSKCSRLRGENHHRGILDPRTLVGRMSTLLRLFTFCPMGEAPSQLQASSEIEVVKPQPLSKKTPYEQVG